MEKIEKGARIRLTDRWQLRAYDSMNWATWEWKPQSGKWKSTGNYFQSVANACAWVAERELRDGGAMGLHEAVDEFRKIAAELAGACGEVAA